MNKRYVIVEQPPDEVALSFGLTEMLYVVWDTVNDRRVPFGNYGDRDRAEARITRLENKE